MSSLSRNSCAKAFGNWSRGENFRLKKPRGGSTDPPATLRVNIFKNTLMEMPVMLGNYSMIRMTVNALFVLYLPNFRYEIVVFRIKQVSSLNRRGVYARNNALECWSIYEKVNIHREGGLDL